MKREIIEIDEEKSDGCRNCVPNCPEGALQVIDGKATLVSDIFCDWLGACIGHCPQGAIKVIEREAEEYNEKQVMQNSIVPKGKNTIKAHLQHLKEHAAEEYLRQAEKYLKEKGIENPMKTKNETKSNGFCPGSKEYDFSKKDSLQRVNSQLTNWPIQLHLVNPAAEAFKDSDLVIAADCTAYALGDFHNRFMTGKSLTIACPKLDSGLDIYEKKLTQILSQAKSVSVVIMEVPCCKGLMQLVLQAYEKANTQAPLKNYVIGINGEIKKEEYV